MLADNFNLIHEVMFIFLLHDFLKGHVPLVIIKKWKCAMKRFVEVMLPNPPYFSYWEAEIEEVKRYGRHKISPFV